MIRSCRSSAVFEDELVIGMKSLLTRQMAAKAEKLIAREIRSLAGFQLRPSAASIPCSKASGEGGQPRIVASTGMTLLTAPRLA